ncbi:nitrogenase cofactor synthesis protein [cyanobacterium endosymbiont of Rhopalodia gibberula]|uniref:cysteine desulfurase NifS n=1 Tax=cyanobacterium endosymbiont of Rhopalodia gibberula TaxID=1763363 RepID=UPI000DC6DE51|nr:cysteine desulfurase NifS [cyanobacterium endosymbiont of Rhopalodia gibberula]BBA79958.1 nitrogenase cofactor synthesis protein [cyanobacterium endosymbiont of Rhopalodia gibberula]
MKDCVYLDNNATTQVDEEVLAAMLPYLTHYYGNPSSMHTFGGQVGLAVKTGRQQVASLLGAEPSEIVFTSCGTEGDNAAIHAALLAQPNKRHIITSKVEHPAVLNLCKSLERQGYIVTYLSVDDQGQLDLSEFEASLTQNTALVTLMYANNETGVIFPIEQVGQLAKKYGAIFHVDAVQVVGKIPLDMRESTIDMLTLSGHKIHAPKGIGALYVRRGTRFRPLLIGGHQERGRRGGTENVPGIVALGKAAELAESHLIMGTGEKELRDYLEQTILTTIPDTVLNGHAVKRLPNTSNIGFKFIEGEAILLSLNQHGICASSGSACTSGSLEPSHVLRAMGLPYTVLHGSIRFSLSRFTTYAQVQKVLEVLPGIIDRLRALSPFTSDDAGWLVERQQATLAK